MMIVFLFLILKTNEIPINNQTSDNNTFSNFAGAVYIFSRNGANWSQHAYIKSSNIDESDLFGGNGGKGIYS